MKEDLKNYDNTLVYFVLFNIAIFFWIELNIIENLELISTLLTIPIYYFPVYLFNNFLPSDCKFLILYPLKVNHHYASDIFTKICNKKIKVKKELIDINLIFNNHRTPKNNNDEDKLWFELYYKHRYDNKVYQQHRRFLFCRDYTMMILPLFTLFILTDYIFKYSFYNELILVSIAIGEFIVFRFLTRYQNKKFALAVLQEETLKLKQSRKKQRISQKSKMFLNTK